MRPEALKLLRDMQSAAEEISMYTGGKTLDDYLSDGLLKRGVERCFEIIGEALTQLSKIDPEVA